MDLPIPLHTPEPDLVAAVYGNGRVEVRHRGVDKVVAEYSDVNTAARLLKLMFPAGFTLDVRYDPHM